MLRACGAESWAAVHPTVPVSGSVVDVLGQLSDCVNVFADAAHSSGLAYRSREMPPVCEAFCRAICEQIDRYCHILCAAGLDASQPAHQMSKRGQQRPHTISSHLAMHARLNSSVAASTGAGAGGREGAANCLPAGAK
eukprot:185023-Pleurochrysis_carterae.AAC.1